jgi:hypothetical protein
VSLTETFSLLFEKEDKMGLARLTTVDDIFFFGDEMDPVYEDRLAMALDEYARDRDRQITINFQNDEEIKGNVLVVSLEPSKV